MAKQAKLAAHGASSFKDTHAISTVNAIFSDERHSKVAAELNHHDTWPNIDGHIEVLDDEKRPVGVFSAQVKSLPRDGKLKFACPTSLLVYAKEIHPAFLIVFDHENKKAYWLYFDEEIVSKLDYQSKETLTVELLPEQFFSEDATNYIQEWRDLFLRRQARFQGLDEKIKSHINRHIDTARELIKGNRYSEALKALVDLRESSWNDADAKARFRILTNMGVAQVHLGLQDEATENWLNAYDLQPHDPLAKSNMAAAYLMRGKNKRALELSKEILKLNPLNPQATVIQVQAMAALEDKLDVIINSVDEKLLDTSDVAYAIGFVAHRRELRSEAVRWLERAVHKDTKDPDVLAHLGACLLDSVMHENEAAIDGMLSLTQISQVRRAAELLEKAWSQLSNAEDKKSKSEWLANRILACRMLREECDIEKATEELLLLEPENESYQKNAAVNAMESGKWALAEGRIRKLLKQGSKLPELKIMLANVLLSTNRLEEAKSYINEFLSDYDKQDVLWVNANQGLFDIYLRANDLDEAQGFADTLMGSPTSKALGALFAARIARIKKDTDRIPSLLESGNVSLGDNPDSKLVLDMANEAYSSALYKLAASLYEKVVNSEVDNIYTRRYLHSLFETERYRQVIDIAKKFREASQFSREIAQFEWAALLELRDVSSARKVLVEYIKHHPDDEELRLNIASIDVRTNHLRRVDSYLKSNIDVKKLSLQSGIQLAHLYNLRNKPEQTLELIYSLRHRFPDSPDAHSAFISIFIELGDSVSGMLEVSTVQPDTVLIYEGGHFVIEGQYEPRISDNEISVEDATQRGFIGKKVGEEVELTRNTFVEAKKVEITDIKSKYLFALHDSMQNFERRFYDRNDLTGFSVEDGDLSPLLKQLDQRRKHTEQVENFYRSGKITIDLFAKLVNRDLLDVFYSLRSMPELGVRAASGAPEEVKSLQSHLSDVKEPVFVADITALITLFELGFNVQDLGLNKLIIPQTAKDLIIQRIIKDQTMRQKERTTLYKHEGRYIRQEITAKEASQNLRHLKAFKKWIDENTEVMPLTQEQLDATIPDTKPEKLKEIIDVAQLDTIRLAYGEGKFLYSDDYDLRALAANTFGTKGIWTQALLSRQQNKGHINRNAYENSSIELARSNYHFTAINPGTLIESVKQANNQVKSPFNEVVKAMIRPETNIASVATVTSNFLYELYKQSIVLDKAPFIRQILTEVAHSHDIKRFTALLRIALKQRFEMLPHYFDEINAVLKDWGDLHEM